MIIKEAVYKKVKVTQNKLIENEIYGCDCCKQEIKEHPNEDNRLEITVFGYNDENKHFHFCSWDCVFAFISELNEDFDFINLPFVYKKDVNISLRGIERLQQLIKERS